MNYSKILTIKDVEEYEQADNDNYILIITEGLITLISRNQLQYSFFLSDVESPVFALHERDDRTSHIRGMFFYCKTQRLLAEQMLRNTWRTEREKFPSFKTQRLLAEQMLRNTWRTEREKFPSFKTQRLLAEQMLRNTWRTEREKFPSFYLTKIMKNTINSIQKGRMKNEKYPIL